MPQFQTLEFSIEDSVAIIKFNRSDAANGLNLEMAKELNDAVNECIDHTDVRAILLTANGKMFSAGGDLKAFAAYGNELSDKMADLIHHMHEAVEKLASFDAPVVTAINGMAAGAGFSLAIGGDIVVAAKSAKFTMAYTAAGLSPDGGASYYLTRLIGLRKTQELMLTNNRLSANEALELGIVTQVVADDELFDTAFAIAKKFAQGPTRAYSSVKQLLMNSLDNDLKTQLDLEATLMTAMSKSKDGKEGIDAFVNKRKPDYTGQ